MKREAEVNELLEVGKEVEELKRLISLTQGKWNMVIRVTEEKEVQEEEERLFTVWRLFNFSVLLKLKYRGCLN